MPQTPRRRRPARRFIAAQFAVILAVTSVLLGAAPAPDTNADFCDLFPYWPGCV